MKKLMALLGLSLLMVTPAHAIFELRGTYTGLASGPDLSSLYTGTQTVPKTVPNYGPGGDLLIFIPFAGGLGIGARYESLGFKPSLNGFEYKSVVNRTAAVLSYRLVNTFLHIGPIATYGTTHKANIKVDDGVGGKYDWTPDSVSSYSVGLEAGLGILAFVIGAEVGYQSLKLKGMKDGNSVSTKTPDIDMSGSYGKVFLGISI